MKKRIIDVIAITAIASILFVSCMNQKQDSNGCDADTTKEKEKKHLTLHHHTINLGNNYIGKAGPIVFLNKKIIGIDFMLDTCLYCFNIEKQTFFRFGTKGQGAQEYIFPYTLQHIRNNEIGIYDIYAKKFDTYMITDTAIFQNSYPISKENTSFDVKRISDNRFLSLGPYEKNMFIITDSIGKKLKSFYEYPYRDMREKVIKNKLRSMAYQGTISLNLSNNKFVYTTSNGDIFHIYKITKDRIKITHKHEKSYPQYFTEEKNEGFGAVFESDNLETYISSSTTDQYIYLLYSGIELGNFVKNRQDICGNILHIYNWEGEKVKTFNLDVYCKQIAVSPDDNTLWAIADNPDTELLYFENVMVQ